MFNRLRFRNFILKFIPFLADLKECLSLVGAYGKWRSYGLPIPAPHPIKRALLMREAKRINADIFIETGTYTADTVWFMRNAFRKIFSIEVQPDLAEIARNRFRNFNNIKIIEGDSAKLLGTLVNEIDATTLFWLDGHYSAGVTGRGEKDCPIFEELDAIKAISPESFSIIIDDYRCFGTDPAYPSYIDLYQRIKELFPNHKVEIELDMIWCRE